MYFLISIYFSVFTFDLNEGCIENGDWFPISYYYYAIYRQTLCLGNCLDMLFKDIHIPIRLISIQLI